jgi:hypothetical protein
MFNRLIFLFCLPMLFLRAAPVEETSEKFSVGPVPAWVKLCDFDASALPDEASEDNYQVLLKDKQLNWEEKTHYRHKAIKILTQTAAHDFTQLSMDFNPDYQHVIVHYIHVLRNGETLNCLEKSRYKLLQREDDLEENLYLGDLALVYFLNDIRKGDTVEYAYSVVGMHPFTSSHCEHWIVFKHSNSVDKVYQRILIHPERLLQIKSDNPAATPNVVDLSPTLREWSWEMVHTAKLSEDKEEPIWHGLFDEVAQISEYKSWQEVAQKNLTLYKLPEDFETNPLPEMLVLIEQWIKSTDDHHHRALLALRFVQDEIKYLGFEDGLGGHKPTDPRVVFSRRFGDCKDKSVLLYSLLKLMEIESVPVLVNAFVGKKLSELLPSQSFNHAVLRIEIDGSYYWVDPVHSFQGGSLQTTYFPNYHWGLVISPDTQDLTPIPFPVLDRPIDIRTSILITSPTTAELKIEKTGYGFRAEANRLFLQQLGMKNFSKVRLGKIQTLYKGASLLSPLVILDNREENEMTITECYRLSISSRTGKKLLKISSAVLGDYLDNGINLERSSPYALDYPLWVKEHIHIENPFNDWAHEVEEVVFENKAVKYGYQMSKEGHTADFHFELKHHQDHVPVDLIQDYWNIVQEVEPNPSLEVVITAPAKA